MSDMEYTLSSYYAFHIKLMAYLDGAQSTDREEK